MSSARTRDENVVRSVISRRGQDSGSQEWTVTGIDVPLQGAETLTRLSGRWYFRGQRDSRWSLLPSLRSEMTADRPLRRTLRTPSSKTCGQFSESFSLATMARSIRRTTGQARNKRRYVNDSPPKCKPVKILKQVEHNERCRGRDTQNRKNQRHGGPLHASRRGQLDSRIFIAGWSSVRLM